MGASYHKRKQELRYFRQRGGEMLAILQQVDRELARRGIHINLPLHHHTIAGDQLVTDINSGQAEFGLTHISGNFA